MSTTPTSNKAPDPDDLGQEPDIPDTTVPGRPGPVLPPGGGSSTPGATAAIDAQTLICVDQQETNLTGGDEVYIASLAFRTTPGKAGSTSVWFHGNLQNIPKVKTGTTHAIPNTMGRVPFANVVRRSLADVQAGRNPELVGTVPVVLESDLTAKSAITKVFQDAVPEIRTILADLIEPLSLADLANASQLSARFAAAAGDVQAALTPKVGRIIGLFLGSLGDPDDLIDAKLNLFVAVDDALAPLVDQAVGAAVPSGLGKAGALRTRSHTLRYAGKGAVYDVKFDVTI